MSLQSTLRRHPVWVFVGIALLAAVAYVVRAFIGTLVFGLFLYYATRPVYNRIEGGSASRASPRGSRFLPSHCPP